MPKTLKLTVIFIFILAIFAPEAQILAQEGPLDRESSYLPSHQQWTEKMTGIPVRVFNYIKQAIPFTPAQWQNATKNIVIALKDAANIENVKNFFIDAMRVLGNIKDFFLNLIMQFYKKLYP